MVLLGTVAAIVAISLFNGNERAINDVITAMVGLLLIFFSAGLNLMHRSRLNRQRSSRDSA